MLCGGRLIATSDADAKKSAHARVNPATARAVVCLAQNDHDSLAWIIAIHPARIIADLLNENLFTQGAIFSDRNIWTVMAHALAAAHAAGSSADSLEALTLAAENFLRYHNVPNKQAPRGHSPKTPQPHAAGGQFTLAHQADALSQTADRA
jgi:hypothetical protein